MYLRQGKNWKVGRMVCCRCNKTGSCTRCACAKSGKVCNSCLPGKLGKCTNTSTTIVTNTLPTSAVTGTAATNAGPDVPPGPSDSPRPSQVPTTPSKDQDPAEFLEELALVDINNASCSNIPLGTAEFLDALEDLSLSDSDPSQLDSAAQAAVYQQTSTWPPALPTPTPLATPSFVWGKHDVASFTHSLTAAYAEVTHWKKNQFTVPLGNTGNLKKFIGELSWLFRASAEQSALESITLLATTVMLILLLQKPAFNNVSCLECRLKLWFKETPMP